VAAAAEAADSAVAPGAVVSALAASAVVAPGEAVAASGLEMATDWASELATASG
jgi:hypothetical protein